eukprot:347881_1
MPIGDLSIIIQQIQIYSDGLKPTHHKLKSIKIEPIEVIDLLSDGDDEEEDDDAVCREMKHEAEQTCNGTQKRRKRSFIHHKNDGKNVKKLNKNRKQRDVRASELDCIGRKLKLIFYYIL